MNTRTNVKINRLVVSQWRSATRKLGYGERGMVKLLRNLLDYAEKNPSIFSK
jgi:hypothetical protein